MRGGRGDNISVEPLRPDVVERTINLMSTNADPFFGIVEDMDAAEKLVAESGGTLVLLPAETPSERACSVLEGGFRFWPSRVTKIVFTNNPSDPVMGADESL